MRGWGVSPLPLAMLLMFTVLLLLSTTCVNAWSFSSIVDSFSGRSSLGHQSSRLTSANFGQGGQNMDTKDSNGETAVDGPRDEATIITAPRRRRTNRCKAGQRMDWRGKCRKVW